MKKKGFVYILTNPSFREDWVKIGKSARPVEVRLKELDNTAIPLPFEVYATLETEKFDQVEKLIHKMIDRLTSLRIRQNREFFNIHPQIALDILKDIATIIDDVVVDEVHLRESNKSEDEVPDDQIVESGSGKERRSRFKFSMVGIPIGANLVFQPANLEVRVCGDDTIEYEGRIYKLSPFVGTFMPEDRRNPSGAYQGSQYFTYQGRVLQDLRNEKEFP